MVHRAMPRGPCGLKGGCPLLAFAAWPMAFMAFMVSMVSMVFMVDTTQVVGVDSMASEELHSCPC